MITITLLGLQKKFKNYYLPYDIAELIPLFTNFDVNHTLTTCTLASPRSFHEFHENYYTIQQLIRIENVNVFHSIVLSDKQYSIIDSFVATQKNEGNLMFVLIYYFVFSVMLYTMLNARVQTQA
jgi:hypothetical protein